MACTVCGNEDTLPLLSIPGVPVHCNLLWDSAAAAKNAPKGTVDLHYCESCGHIFNQTFNPSLMEYTQAYENSLHFSATFQRYADEIAQTLVERYQLFNKTIVEIGAGQGDFLVSLCRLGNNHGIGFDPSFDPTDAVVDDRVSFVEDFYSVKYSNIPADFICSRHVLEHIHRPTEFLRELRLAVDKKLSVTLFFEVPNALYTLRDLGIWDIIYEHCSYFTPSSLMSAFQLARFDVLRQDTAFAGQFLTLEARPTSDAKNLPPQDARLTEMAQQFGTQYAEKMEYWHETLQQFSVDGKRVVIWGGGSKGVTFLNVMGSPEVIEAVVDINPRKQGRFIAGTGHPYVSPSTLAESKPDVVLVMNSIYRDEISAMLAEMGLSPEIMLV